MQKQRKLVDVRKALSGKQMDAKQRAALRGGDDLEGYPWIDKPGG
ncbi:MAG: hypothetical protein U0176_06805 [Bacteroidia bacterium]